jgi:hypothetical protein
MQESSKAKMTKPKATLTQSASMLGSLEQYLHFWKVWDQASIFGHCKLASASSNSSTKMITRKSRYQQSTITPRIIQDEAKIRGKHELVTIS